MAVDLKKYLEGLAQDAGLDEASRSTLLKVIENEKFAKPLADGISRQEDYSRNMDVLAKARTEFESQKSSWQDWYKTASETDAARETELQELRKKVGTGGGGGGTGGGGGNGGGAGMTRKELDDLLSRERSQLIAVTKDMGKIASRHSAEFHEALDVDAVEKIAIEKGLTVVKAYEEYVRPRVEERQKADIDARIKAAREEGLKEGLSKHGVPDDASAPRGHHVLFDRPKADAVPDTRQRVANFAEAWNSVPANKP